MAIDEVGAVLAALDAVGIRLEMLDIGGGFPARYAADVPPLAAYGDEIGRALDRLPTARASSSSRAAPSSPRPA